ncbi:Purine nucleoside phosphoramidase/Ap4A hydrolase [Commensalibacter communis]|uniref:Histidine triade (HIT) family (HinT) n=1 Tax=Commensalibacter communis TaxID=2972786 RepID=A0A9W4TKQ0_9PROT|nr:histidine triad nucleotide-binding protein [Commensalibacter communis]CAI3926412.1 Purine nucleoside phosphoramidase/Ap4A hydrolase [Commensalibacter communis]CAI3927939.1 Purine nucleoside phosphoramidase/Ap4A hydrolase [Commensalibacter communis]CAI3934564.1 Purine nucleoside phosphoramidase/Ap4A hydrolase [Commensalibacter communis]CAI3935088.1 Purine nucleoside phosphoramidase/Ap4A hydrolase [Commensalibacter communis]
MSINISKYDPQNIFAKILRKEIPCKAIYENDFVLAFHDIAPQAPVHALIIPKNPYTCYSDFAERAAPEELVAFSKAIAYVAKELGLEDNGYRIISNIGRDSGQEVPHFHFHIMGGKQLGFMG